MAIFVQGTLCVYRVPRTIEGLPIVWSLKATRPQLDLDTNVQLKIREPPTIAIQLACPDQISFESINRWPLISNEISKDCARPMSHLLVEPTVVHQVVSVQRGSPAVFQFTAFVFSRLFLFLDTEKVVSGHGGNPPPVILLSRVE